MTFMSLKRALEMGVAVGVDPKVAIAAPGNVVFVANRGWDESCTREAAAMVDWQGDQLVVPPFELKAGSR